MSSKKITIDYQEYLDLLEKSKPHITVNVCSGHWSYATRIKLGNINGDESSLDKIRQAIEATDIQLREYEIELDARKQTIKNLQNECKELRSEHEKEINRILEMSVWQFVKWRSL